ncbi:MAG TPA: Y-family DNA polymerase [Albitalea sp.]|uniref:Y-family DNA polymerase n=1 Tax=Piscinibacter sp. TaxID=1903157 RepID=UPI002ED1DAF4
MYALVDVNNMYASCERVMNPRLLGRPLVVLSSNDGACIARSDEAKALGIEMAQPWFEVRHLERTAGLVALSANFELYADMSSRVMAILGRYAPRQEVYSIDESFLHWEGVRGDLIATAREMRATVIQETGLPCCVGLAWTKTLAKLANHVAKSAERKPGSYPRHLAQFCHLGRLSEVELQTIFAATDVGNIWGVGRRIRERLVTGGVKTVLDFVRADTASIRRQFSVVLEKTLLELRGTSCLDIDDAPASRQQILVSRSFGKSVTTLEGIVEAVSEFASRAAERLRAQASVAGAVNVFFTTSPFREHDRQHSLNFVVPLPQHTADSRLLVAAAVNGVRRHFRPGFNYAKAGAMLMDLQDAKDANRQAELDLFSQAAGDEPAARARDRSALMQAMDGLNHRFGRDSVRIGSAAVVSNGGEVRSWSVKQERRTPRYTTRWDEIAVVRA